jgi:hypothetical protein
MHYIENSLSKLNIGTANYVKEIQSIYNKHSLHRETLSQLYYSKKRVTQNGYFEIQNSRFRKN